VWYSGGVGRAPDPKDLKAYRRMRLYFIGIAVGSAVSVVAGLVQLVTVVGMGFEVGMPLAVAVVGMLLWGLSHQLWIESACPRCAGSWGVRRRKDRKALLRAPTMRCLHCGLPFAAARDPDGDED